jgi:hypothetical protein
MFVSQANNIGNSKIPDTGIRSPIPFVHRIVRKFSRVSRKAVTRNVPDVLKLFHRHSGMDNPDVLKPFHRHSVWIIRISVLVKVNGICQYSFIDLILPSFSHE